MNTFCIVPSYWLFCHLCFVSKNIFQDEVLDVITVTSVSMRSYVKSTLVQVMALMEFVWKQ